MVKDGFIVFDVDEDVLKWAGAALQLARAIAADPDQRRANLRHGQTWFVGVDALPNRPDGSISRIKLKGPWEAYVTRPAIWHAAQLSIVYPGYPLQDHGESDANHRFRINRFAAHVDGLLPLGPERRRFLKEPHAFVLGLPLNQTEAAPLMVWPGSHHIMGAAFRSSIQGDDPESVDITEAYQVARSEVFRQICPQKIVAKPGQSVLLHRHLLHGMAPWDRGACGPVEGRMIAYFRPQFSALQWLTET